ELRRSADTISRIDPAAVRAAADVIKECVARGGQVIFMGNGGSSADAQHIAAEFSGKYAFDRPAMAGVCLSNIAPVTAIGNDYSYDDVFKRQVEAFCRKGDVAVGFSTSGNSKNIILALEAAKKIGAYTISFTGEGGKLRETADLPFIIPSRETPRIQEGYLVACHTICGTVEREIFGRKAVLLDRDDTIIKDFPYTADPEKVELLPGAGKAVARLNRAGYLVIVVTNQSGIGRGSFGEDALARTHDRMTALIEKEGGRLDDILFCPHHPDDRCGCRKPEIGMGEAAILRHNINPSASFMIGDMDRDIEFGKRLGLRTVRVDSEHTLADAVDGILGE
ncbi:MAG: HAD-IIIA family hydrolase, partial [Candidatus Methanoplasma sp.]|nr:HAD-IIIA family hydrolase [Candidatus Methanoplasma sp.]